LSHARPSAGLEDLTEKQRAALTENGASLVDGSAPVTFDSLTQEAILRRLLPDVVEITSRFEQVGHIAHVNLQPHLLPHKYIIGAVLLEKNASLGVRTVVNKTNFIENQFRVLPMEIIAGPDETMVELEENGSKFRFDFREVFWNSRLLNEHRRIVMMCSPGDVVWDMCAGVGPFAIPLARRGCTVYANDLNPACFKFLNQNADLNLGYVTQFAGCGSSSNSVHPANESDLI
jgi:tRNA (guanine37-N1)-methyltransferase